MELQIKKTMVSLRLAQDIQAQIRQLAKAERCSFSQFVELILEAYLADHQIDTRNTVLFEGRMREADGISVRDEVQTDTTLMAIFPPEFQHEVWSPTEAYEAAAALQTLLQERTA